ncbi:MAG: hypothetical protein LBG46_02725 [Elusimicrobiota bacterium]|jgi:cell division septal protein FtsQ|nr:hypothetical protein [Elusimicrobiota bacterium]
MHIRKKSSKKYFAASRGSKRRTKRQKKFLIITTAILIILTLLWWAVRSNGFLSNIKAPNWLVWRVKDIKITGETKDMQYEASKYVSFEKGDEITARDCSNLEEMLLNNLKQLSSVKVNRNFFTKELNVKIKKHIPIAKIIIDGGEYYLAENGFIFDDKELKGNGGFFPLYIKNLTKKDFLSQELVKLISEINSLKDIIISAVYIEQDAKTMNIEIENVAFAQIGGYANAGEKLMKLAEILAVSSQKNFKKPYKIDFRYFDYGKVYLAPAV